MTESSPRPLSQEAIDGLRGTLSGIAELRNELRSQLDATNHEVSSVWTKVSESAVRLDDREKRLDEKETKITELATKVHKAAEQHSKHRGELEAEKLKSAELMTLLKEATEDRDSDRSKLQSALSELDSLSDMLDVLQATQEELDRTRTELQEARSSDDGTSESELQELRRENERLVKELDLNSDRVGQLSETNERQVKELTILRKRWADELASIRCGLGDPVEESASKNCEAPPPEAPIEPEPQPEIPAESVVATPAVEKTLDDPVVDSVLDEFNAFEESAS